MLSLHLVKDGILDLEHAKTFNQLFINRQAGDYEDFIFCDAELYSSLRPKTEDFIVSIAKLLQKDISHDCGEASPKGDDY